MTQVRQDDKMTLTISVLSDTTVLITLTNCHRSHRIKKELSMTEEGSSILHVAVTDIGCNRMDGASVMIPITTPANSLMQLVSDFRSSFSLFNFLESSRSLDLTTPSIIGSPTPSSTTTQSTSPWRLSCSTS